MIWHDGSYGIIAAGAHPNESYADFTTDTIDGDELTLSFDLHLSPSSLRDELHGYIKRVK